ncbi:MAG: hypothetical protein J6K89_02080 [Oscillospiraceae bacterium]|nr:hypothetical protein [Oscillospiraceae bacterium]
MKKIMGVLVVMVLIVALTGTDSDLATCNAALLRFFSTIPGLLVGFLKDFGTLLLEIGSVIIAS